MKLRTFFFLSSIAIFFNSCDYNSAHTPHKTIEYSVVQHSPLFNKSTMELAIDSLDNQLYIAFNLKDLSKFPFPVKRSYNDTLSYTCFNFSLTCNGKPITSDYHSFRNTLSWKIDSSSTLNNLDFTSDTIDIKRGSAINMQIPFYAFHNLKSGKQTIELTVSQSIFLDYKSILKKDSSYDHLRLESKVSMLNATVKFDIQIPPIYKNTLVGLGLQLKNDSTFSPVGMDNTIWNSSYPDLYWSVNCPADYFYAQTPYERSTDKYVAHDTFDLYHYYPNDSIRILVYDHDDLSRDDFLGYWQGSIDYLQKSSLRRITFGNIKWFDLKMGKAEKVN